MSSGEIVSWLCELATSCGVAVERPDSFLLGASVWRHSRNWRATSRLGAPERLVSLQLPQPPPPPPPTLQTIQVQVWTKLQTLPIDGNSVNWFRETYCTATDRIGESICVDHCLCVSSWQSVFWCVLFQLRPSPLDRPIFPCRPLVSALAYVSPSPLVARIVPLHDSLSCSRCQL